MNREFINTACNIIMAALAIMTYLATFGIPVHP